MGANLEYWADYLFEAERVRNAVPPITDSVPDLTVDEAYGISDLLLQRRLDRRERLVGAKAGLTSKAKQVAMGVNEPVFGWLTDTMLVQESGYLRLPDLIHPRVEPEIVFVIQSPLSGPGVGVKDVLRVANIACCGFEVIDSKYENFRFKHPDVVADSTSAARFVLGRDRVI